MQIEWKEVRGTQAERPEAVDTKSSPSTVYLRRNIREETAEIASMENTETMTVWAYQEAALAHEEYEEYLRLSEIFSTPQMLDLKAQIEEQELSLATISADAEYIACLQEMNT